MIDFDEIFPSPSNDVHASVRDEILLTIAHQAALLRSLYKVAGRRSTSKVNQTLS